MAKTKAVVGLLLILIAPAVAGLTFEASIGPELTFIDRKISFDQNVSSLQTANLTVVNTGSIGCKFRLRAGFNNSEETYSRSVALWPGESAFLEVNQVFKKKGLYQGVLQLEYCGKRKKLKHFNFTAQGADNNTEEINSTTLEAGNEGLKVEVPVSEGLLVPEKAPHYWKVSSAEIVNGTASVDLQAPIFDSGESVKFAVYNRSSGKVEAYTTVSMKERKVEPGYWQKKLEMLKENSLVLFLISLVLNLALMFLLVKASPPDIEKLKESVFRE